MRQHSLGSATGDEPKTVMMIYNKRLLQLDMLQCGVKVTVEALSHYQAAASESWPFSHSPVDTALCL